MKPRSGNPRCHPAVVPQDSPAKLLQEADFTAEGSPPPGKVGNERPALPEAGQARPAEVDDMAGRR